MRRYLVVLCVLISLAVLGLVEFPESVLALFLTIILSAIVLILFRRYSDESERELLTNIFLAALAVRIAFGLLVHVFELRTFFGGDAITYDFRGMQMLEYWLGYVDALHPTTAQAMTLTGSGWGMVYLVSSLYFTFGQNIFLAQCFCAVFGAATAPMVYICSKKIFNNKNVATLSAIGIAFFPSFIIWSGQLLKDGLVIFLLVLAMTMVLQLQFKFDMLAVFILILALFGILSLRFYIFYMVVVAVVGSFVIGTSRSGQSIVARTVILVLLGTGLTYFGAVRTATVDLETFGSLEEIEHRRSSLERTAESGFGEETDVSTAEGALSTLPVGLVYLMLAPFPWQMSNLRQAIPLPEVLLWWSLIPVLLFGLWYTINNKLRTAFPILIFSLLLTVGYSLFQGNVGTAYRQRAQIQVFLFMFIAVGIVLWKERRENLEFAKQARDRRLPGRRDRG